MVRISFVNKQRWIKNISCLLLKQTRLSAKTDLDFQRKYWIMSELLTSNTSLFAVHARPLLPNSSLCGVGHPVPSSPALPLQTCE